jgi:hypothetical protein
MLSSPRCPHPAKDLLRENYCVNLAVRKVGGSSSGLGREFFAAVHIHENDHTLANRTLRSRRVAFTGPHHDYDLS